MRGRGLNRALLPAKSLAAQRYVKLQTTRQARGCFHTKSEMSLINHKFKWQMSSLEFQPWLLKENKTQKESKLTCRRRLWSGLFIDGSPVPVHGQHYSVSCFDECIALFSPNMFSIAVLILGITHRNLCALNDAHWSKGLCIVFLIATLGSFSVVILQFQDNFYLPQSCTVQNHTYNYWHSGWVSSNEEILVLFWTKNNY